MKRVQGWEERRVRGDRKNGGGGENEETKRGGERLALLSFCGVPPPLLPHPLFLCISMIKT